MKKFLASAVFVFGFSMYAINQYFTSTSASSMPIATVSAPAPSPEPVAQPAASSPPPNPLPSPAPSPDPTPTPTPAPAPTPSPKSAGEYIDGSYTGTSVYVYYGYVQVKVTISGGKLTDVTFLQYPNDRSTSRRINSQAMPILSQEAISAQHAQVDGVSGATDTSGGFRESLASALSQAKS